jgi:putative ABC transport system substrate-binding protein
MMDRRIFLTTVAGLLATPLAAEAQPKAARLGLLAGILPMRPIVMAPLMAGLHDRGWTEGKNLIIEGRAHAGSFPKALELASELVRLGADATLALGTNSAVAVKQVSDRMPVVTWCGDPVAAGLARSLARPGGNVTGVANYPLPEMFGKLVDLLHEVRPSLRALAILWDFVGPGWPDGPGHLEALRQAAKRLGIRSRAWMVHNENDLLSALSAIDRGKFDALIVSAAGGIHQQPALSGRIAEVVTRRRLPTITNIVSETFANAGCLLTYSSQPQEIAPRLAYFVDKVLRGAKPGDLPIEQPAKFDLIINLKIAKALGLTIPQTLLGRADRVIE